MQRNEFDRRFKLTYDLLEGVEGTGVGVYVCLVDFVCDENKVLFFAETDHVLHVFFFETASCWVTGVNDDDGASIDSLGTGFFEGFAKVWDVK
jgi:hypothetical protein